MHMKRNLTLAVALGLLAVPALNGINNKPAHAAYINQGSVMLSQSDLQKVNPRSTGEGPGMGNKTAGLPWGSPNAGEQTFVGHYNGHTFDLPNNGGPIVVQLDGQSNPSLSEVNAALGDNGEQSQQTTTQQGNTGTQYSNKKTLPQTGEINNQAKRIASSIILGATGLGLGAITLKKHKDQKKSATNNATPDVTSNNGNEIDYLLNNIKNNTAKLNNYTSEIDNE